MVHILCEVCTCCKEFYEAEMRALGEERILLRVKEDQKVRVKEDQKGVGLKDNSVK